MRLLGEGVGAAGTILSAFGIGERDRWLLTLYFIHMKIRLSQQRRPLWLANHVVVRIKTWYQSLVPFERGVAARWYRYRMQPSQLPINDAAAQSNDEDSAEMRKAPQRVIFSMPRKRE